MLVHAQSRSKLLVHSQTGFNDEQLRLLSENMSVVPFSEGETVMQQGEPATWVGILLEGCLSATDANGRVLGHVATGDVCGETAAVAVA